MCRRRLKHDTSEREYVSQQPQWHMTTRKQPRHVGYQCCMYKHLWLRTPAPRQLVNHVISFLGFQLVMNILLLSYSIVSLNPDIIWELLLWQLASGWIAQQLDLLSLWLQVSLFSALPMSWSMSINLSRKSLTDATLRRMMGWRGAIHCSFPWPSWRPKFPTLCNACRS